MEIGSVLELDDWSEYRISDLKKDFILPFMKNGDKSYRTEFFQSARNVIEALLLMLKNKQGIEKVLMPDYICETVRDAAIRAGVKVITYPIDRNYDFDNTTIASNLSDDCCVFIAHFFGNRILNKNLEYINELKKIGYIIIEDITMSLLSADDESIGFGDYIIGSIRKWLPIPDGGFVIGDERELPKAPEKTSVSKYVDYYLTVQSMKREYVRGGYIDKELKENFMKYYSKSIEELFSDYELYPISDWSMNYINNVDFDRIIAKRQDNFTMLYDFLTKIDEVTIKSKANTGYLPMGMVISVEDRDELLKYLIENGVYCNIHWRFHNYEIGREAQELSAHSITIPCDQRYARVEMVYIADVIKKWYEEKRK